MEQAGTKGSHRRPLSDPWSECRSCGLFFFWLRQPDLKVPLADVMLSVQTMDNAVALVQAYLRVNGYFTVAEYPVIEAVRDGQYRAVTDLDILAFRFPNSGRLIPGDQDSTPECQDHFAPDPNLGVPTENADMIIGEVKEGRAELNKAARDADVMRVALRRFGCCTPQESVVEDLLSTGKAQLKSGYHVRLVAFGASPPDKGEPGYEVVLLKDVTDFLEDYIRTYWDVLHHADFKDPALGFLLTLEKARRAAS